MKTLIRPIFLLACLVPLMLPAQSDTLQTQVYFDVGKWALRADARASLDALLGRREGREIVRITLIGRTDQVGSAIANETLAQARCTAVQDYLYQAGVSASLPIRIQSFGERSPLGDTITALGKQKNRSVEVRLSLAAIPVVASDTIKAPIAPQTPVDTVIFMGNGVTLTFNRAEFDSLRDCYDLVLVNTPDELRANNLNTMDAQNRTLVSGGMIWLRPKPGCQSGSPCFKHPVRIRIPLSPIEFMPCALQARIYNLDSTGGNWNVEGLPGKVVTEDGRRYLELEVNCLNEWKNMDCSGRTFPISIAMRKKYRFIKATAYCEFPFVGAVGQNSSDKFTRTTFHVPCITRPLEVDLMILTPNRDTVTLRIPNIHQLKRKGGRFGCLPKGRPYRRILGLFPRYRYPLYSQYFLKSKQIVPGIIRPKKDVQGN